MSASRVEILGELCDEWRRVPEVSALVVDLSATLHAGDQPFVGLPLPEPLTRGRLPTGIESAWVFVLRPRHRNPAHLHPNSTQYTTALSGGGIGFFGDEKVALDPFDPARPAETIRVIPEGTAHAFETGSEPLVVISFHTVAPDRLIEIEVDSKRSRTYLPGDGE